VVKVSRKEDIIGGNLQMLHVHVPSAATTVSRRKLSVAIAVRCFEGLLEQPHTTSNWLDG
jgi:hypothetical protein